MDQYSNPHPERQRAQRFNWAMRRLRGAMALGGLVQSTLPEVRDDPEYWGPIQTHLNQLYESAQAAETLVREYQLKLIEQRKRA